MIHVELGTREPHHFVNGVLETLPGPAVVMAAIPDEVLTFDPSVTLPDLAAALARGTHLPENEALINMLHRDGWWASRSASNPDWVWSDNAEFQRVVAEFFGCEQGRPRDMEKVYWTRSGPPGVGPEAPERGGMVKVTT